MTRSEVKLARALWVSLSLDRRLVLPPRTYRFSSAETTFHITDHGAKCDLEGSFSSLCRILGQSLGFYDKAVGTSVQILIAAGPY